MDQIDNLIIRVQGEEELKRLTAHLSTEEEQFRNLIRLQAQNPGSVPTAQLRASAEAVRDLNRDIKELTGVSGNGGRGLLGASWAVQDFASQFQNMGKTFDAGDIQRAMGSVANNVDQIATAMGATVKTAATMSLAFTGLTVAVPVLAGVFKALWEQIMGPSEAEIDEKMEKIKDKMKKTHDEVQKLIEAPTTTEEEQAGRLKDLLSQRPTAEAVKGGIVAFARTGRVPGRDIFTDEQQKLMKELEQQYLASNFDQAQKIWGRMEQLREQARGGFAERTMQGALQAGPAGARARTLLADIARGAPELFPGGLAADIEQPPETREKQARLEAEGRKNARQFEKERDQELARRQKRAAAQDAQRTRKDIADEEAQNREAARLNKAGQDNEERARKDREKEDRAEEREMMAAAAPEETRRAVNLRAARRNVISEVQNRGLTPNAEQLDQMASAALSGMSNGLGAQQAAWLSVERKLESIRKMAMEFQAAQSRMMMGGDQNGHFPQTPALWP